jgi:hypothetical protein
METRQCYPCILYKKSDKQLKENYRPVSLLTCVGKVMERIVFNGLYEYCQELDLLTWRNSGFKKHESIANELLSLVKTIYKSLLYGNKLSIYISYI